MSWAIIRPPMTHRRVQLSARQTTARRAPSSSGQIELTDAGSKKLKRGRDGSQVDGLTREWMDERQVVGEEFCSLAVITMAR